MIRKEQKIITLTPEYAEELERINNYAAQRNRKEKTVKYLVGQHEKGLFMSCHIAVAHANGGRWLVNGQHQVEFVRRTGASVKGLQEDVYCDDMLEVAQVYRQYDPGGNVRSQADHAKSMIVAMGADWSQTCGSACASALAFAEHGTRFSSVAGKQDRIELLSQHRPDVEFCNKVFFHNRKKDANFLRRVPILAAAINTFRRAPDDAEVFWSAVRDGDMLKNTDPAFKLREYLMNGRVSLYRMAKQGTKAIQGCALAREQYVKSIHAWNAYRKGTNTDLKYYSNGPDPEVL